MVSRGAGRLLVTGAGGMLGRAFVEAVRGKAVLTALSRTQLDVADAAAVQAAVAANRPDVIVNLAGYTAVDRAESEPETALRINRDGAANVARAATAAGARVVYVSTDYVFDGRAANPYPPDAAAAPRSSYGRSKWLGEEAVREGAGEHVIVRTSWVFAPWGTNFVRTIVRLAREGRPLRVVDDQTGTPTSAIDLADAIVRLIAVRNFAGTVHFANAGPTTWHGFAEAILAELRAAGETTPPLYPVTTAEYGAAAARPRYSVLDTTTFTAVTGIVPRPWSAALRDTMAALE